MKREQSSDRCWRNKRDEKETCDDWKEEEKEEEKENEEEYGQCWREI